MLDKDEVKKEKTSEYDCDICPVKGFCTCIIDEIPAKSKDYFCKCERETYFRNTGIKIEPKNNKEEYDTNTKITNYDVDWKRIKSACMTTIRKQAGDKEPTSEWKRKLLICQHSPIRRGIIS